MKLLHLRPRRGQSMVELALILPVCLWLLLGIVDFGRVYFFYITASNVAREGARYWASNNSATCNGAGSTTVETKARAEAASQTAGTSFTITCSQPTDDQYQVQVQYSFTALTPMISNLWGGGARTLTTQAVMPKLTG